MKTLFNTPRFFIDTANLLEIQRISKRLMEWKEFNPKSIIGITTNPNAMSKCDIHSLSAFNNRVRDLCKLVTEIRKDDRGIVYVQYPADYVNVEDLIAFAKQIAFLSDGSTRVGLKIPPYFNILNRVAELAEHCDVNVTGVADCSTALLCLTYGVKFVSIIPGRMEESGIDANAHLEYLYQRNFRRTGEIITGSMRNLNGLADAIRYGTVPTIGTKVFDLVFESMTGESFVGLWDTIPRLTKDYSPIITEKSVELSKAFFKQMNAAGDALYADMITNTKE